MRPGAIANQRTLLWLKWRVTANSYRRALRRRRGWLTFAGLALAFTVEWLVFAGLVAAVGYLKAAGFVQPPGFEWTAVALLPLYLLLLLPSATVTWIGTSGIFGASSSRDCTLANSNSSRP